MQPGTKILLAAWMTVGSVSPQAVAASDWRHVGTAEDGELQFVDIETMISIPPSVKFWVYGIASPSNKTVKSWKLRVTINCSSKMQSPGAMIFYNKDGTIENDGANLIKFREIIPDSMGQAQMRFACSLPAYRSQTYPRLSVSPEEYAASAQTYLESTPPK